MVSRSGWKKIDSGTDEAWLLRHKKTGCSLRVSKAGRRWSFVVGCGPDVVDGRASTKRIAKKKAVRELRRYVKNFWQAP